MSDKGSSAVGLLSYETLVHAVAGAMVSRDKVRQEHYFMISMMVFLSWSYVCSPGVKDRV